MHPLELAEQLGESILASDEYQSFTHAQEIMEQSDAAVSLIENFQAQQLALNNKQSQGQSITPELVEELQTLQRQMVENQEIKAYLIARQKVDSLLAAVNETIARITGMETGRSGGCGDCSGDCG
ncbi:MAG TPA: YlbF family regulator [Oscillospiraceae bacterium]|nr:YlbF family regulator [Oscillospiraceae bacterium]